MRKYYLIAKRSWDEILQYRINFFTWRLRVVLGILAIYFVWASVLPEGAQFFNYNQSTMLTYVLGISFVASFVTSSRSHEIGGDINSGALTNFLLKPIGYFNYWFVRDIGDKAMNILCSFIEYIILFIILKPPLFIQTDPFFLFFAGVFLVLGLFLYFWINILLSLFAFWNPEVWAPRFVFWMIAFFLAGNYFPLDVLPKQIFDFLAFTPFAYLLYFPLKIYLGQVALGQIFFGFFVIFFWTIIFYGTVLYTWRFGLKNYGAQGR